MAAVSFVFPSDEAVMVDELKADDSCVQTFQTADDVMKYRLWKREEHVEEQRRSWWMFSRCQNIPVCTLDPSHSRSVLDF